MLDRSGNLIALPSTHIATAGLALSMLMITAGAGWPQAASPPSSPSPSLGIQTPAQQAMPAQPAPAQGEPAPSSPPPVRQENPGLINEMGKMFEKSMSILPTLKSPGETIDDLNARAKGAGEALSRLTTPSMVTGRMMLLLQRSNPLEQEHGYEHCSGTATSAGAPRSTVGPQAALGRAQRATPCVP